MSFPQKIKKLLRQFDLFYSSQFLRYNQQNQYKTLTGGLLSLGVIAIIILGFASMIIDTINKTSISSTLTTIKQADPPYAQLIPGQENNFMFAISIDSIDLMFNANLSASPRFFDVQMNIAQVSNGYPNYTRVPIEQCTKQHWRMVPSIYDNFDLTGASGWLCVPLNYVLPLRGAFSSAVSEQIVIRLYPCTNSSFNNDSCASQGEIDSLFDEHKNFYLNLVYVNPVINPNKQNYMSYYLEGNDYIIFSKDLGSEAWIYFTDYTIKTDESILPYSDIVTKSGCIVENKAINHPYSSANTSFATIFLAKSSNSIVYNRQVQKISAVFAFIGGLVGAVTALLFLAKSYTDSSLQITIGLNLFSSKEKDIENDGQERIHQFNILGFIRLAAYRFLKLIKWKGEWKMAERLQKYQEEAVKQLDIHILLKRLIMLETCIDRLLPKKQLDKIKESQQESLTLKSAKRMRTLLVKNKETHRQLAEQYGEKSKEDKVKETQSDMISNVNQATWHNVLQKEQKPLSNKASPHLEQKFENERSGEREMQIQMKDNQIATKITNDLFMISANKSKGPKKQLKPLQKHYAKTKTNFKKEEMDIQNISEK